MTELAATCTRCGDDAVPPRVALDPDTKDLCRECVLELAQDVMVAAEVALEDTFEDFADAMRGLGDVMEGLDWEDSDE